MAGGRTWFHAQWHVETSTPDHPHLRSTVPNRVDIQLFIGSNMTNTKPLKSNQHCHLACYVNVVLPQRSPHRKLGVQVGDFLQMGKKKMGLSHPKTPQECMGWREPWQAHVQDGSPFCGLST